jgi:DNA gyrase inhibitor GyrI
MADLKVRIEKLPRMWVASVRASGEAPEVEAWRRLRQWAIPKGLLSDCDRHPVFGFNNPNPSADRKEYGYELWIRVDAPEAGDDEVAFKEFEGGLFAVTTCRLQGGPDIVTTWRSLWDWARHGPHRWRRAQELERVLNPNAREDELVLELYLPIDDNAAPPESRNDAGLPRTTGERDD